MAKGLENFDFDKLMRRSDRDSGSASKLPTELFQIAVFYSQPAANEIKFWDKDKQLNYIKEHGTILTKKRMSNSFEDFEDLTRLILEDERFIFPFYSQEVFTVKTDAINFAPSFIRKLINDQKLPKEVLNEDNTVNDDILKVGIAPLNIVFLEKEISEFKE